MTCPPVPCIVLRFFFLFIYPPTDTTVKTFPSATLPASAPPTHKVTLINYGIFQCYLLELIVSGPFFFVSIHFIFSFYLSCPIRKKPICLGRRAVTYRTNPDCAPACLCELSCRENKNRLRLDFRQPVNAAEFVFFTTVSVVSV